MLKRILLSSFLLIGFLHSIQIPVHQYAPIHPTVDPPWFTGPLLAPSGVTIPPGHCNIEPYIYSVAITGAYNKDWKPLKSETFWNNYFQPSLQFGINNWLDFQFNPTLFYNYKEGAAKWVLGDMPIGFDIQLYHPKRTLTQWNVAIKLALKEIIPLGKYQNLDPKKFRTDVGGGGTWQTGLGIVWGNIFYIGGNRFITWRNSFQYILPAPVRVKNFNAYGGSKGTKGTVYPAQNFQYDTAIEISITRRWVFAMDFVGTWTGKTRFKGKTSLPVSSPRSLQFSLAPAIEYNWNDSIGIIFGPWFTIAGKNAVKFISGVFAFNYYH
jgi:hypothetical protein